MSKLGLNVVADGNYDRAKLFAFLSASRPPVVTIINNSQLALDVQVLFPTMLVVYRRHPDDSISSSGWKPEEWVRSMAHDVPDSRILLYAGNEPGRAVLAELSAWTLFAMTEANALGRRLVVGNFGVGGPEDSDWEGPLYPLLVGVCESGGRHVIGVHEYADYHNWRYSGPNLDATKGPIGSYVNYDPLDGNNWLIARYQRITAIALRHGLDAPYYIVTEFSFDSLIDSFHGWLAGSTISASEYTRQVKEMDTLIYGPDAQVLGLCIFCWDSNYG